jgi:hypothetical protein
MLTPGPTGAFQNEPTGFRGIEWSTPITELKSQMLLIGNRGNNSFYSRSGDEMKIGDAAFTSIGYHFYKGRLAPVIITAAATSSSGFVQAFEVQFGQPTEANEYVGRYIWPGTISRIIIHCNTITSECPAGIQSLA